MTIQHPRPATARYASRTALALLIAACFAGAGATPTSPTVVAGQATFSQQGNVFSITNTPNTVINWASFSVNAGDVTRFIQQSADSAVLNRITGQDPSRILGALQSNGHVFLINPNGIMFGKDSRVDVNGLTASTLDLGNADFLSGKRNFKAGAVANAIVNEGRITTAGGGHVFLIASDVTNAGVITSPQGEVVLAAGHSVQLVDSSNPDLHVVVSAPANAAVNLGQIMSQGGRVGIYGALVSQRGIVNADSAQLGANGKIVLKASREAMLEAGSVTSANGAGNGGMVTVEGQRVGMRGDARIEASGNTGGGTVLLGGGYQGKNPALANAQDTLMGANSSIRADAINSGNGGTVVVWGESTTRAAGSISAQGGALAGNGGLVETSGKHLEVDGIRVKAGAAKGAAGTWLLDPTNIDVTTGGNAALTDADQFADPGTLVTISPATINAVSPDTNIVLQATNDVTITLPISPTLGAAGSLTIDAGHNILIDSTISTAGGALTLAANYPGYSNGTGNVVIMPSAALLTNGGKLSVTAVAGDFGGAINTSGGNISIANSSYAKFGGNIQTFNGNITVNASSIDLGGNATSLNSGSGNILLRNTSGPFSLGPTWTMSSGGNIDIIANSASLFGNIGGVSGAKPNLSFSPYTPGTGITVASAGAGGSLLLDPARLAAFDAQAIVLGSNTTGAINVSSPYSGGLTKFLTLTGQGNINVASGISLPSGSGSSLLLQIDNNSSGTISTSAPIAADSVFLTAGELALGAAVTATGSTSKIRLAPNVTTGAIELGAGATDRGGVLALDSAELAQLHALDVKIGGNSGQSGAVTITGAANFTGLSSASTLGISSSESNMTFNGDLTTLGSLQLAGNDLQTPGAAKVTASSIQMATTFGIGANGVPFNTKTGALSVTNTRTNGIGPINISNSGTLSLGNIHQDDATNFGPISIANAGGMTLTAGSSVVTHGNGNLQLSTMSPLSIFGDVISESGDISLIAGNGGLLTIGAGANVSSTSGNIGLTAGDIINDGAIHTGGNINVSAATFTGGGSMTAGGSVSGVPTPPSSGPPPPPTVAQCVTDPSLPDCQAIVKAAFDQCLVNPNGPDCKLVLPPISACIADKTVPGCVVVLPSLPSCRLDSSQLGCSVVLPSILVCIADKNVADCGYVLPPLQSCIGDKSILGCSVVLPTVQQCISDKNTAGCSVVLPSLPICIGDKNVAGCIVVLPSLQACIGNKNIEGCSVVLPSITICIGNAKTAGCEVVLPTLPQCIANAKLLGCSVVLPTITECIAKKTTDGCAVVLPTLEQCIANRGILGCIVVLPSLSQCVSAPSTAGCIAVLPSLEQCIASPSLQGCDVVLPPIATCVAHPERAGCPVVAPPPIPPAGGPVDKAISTTITALNASTGTILDDAKDKAGNNGDKGGKTLTLLGEKIENRPKTYCN